MSVPHSRGNHGKSKRHSHDIMCAFTSTSMHCLLPLSQMCCGSVNWFVYVLVPLQCPQWSGYNMMFVRLPHPHASHSLILVLQVREYNRQWWRIESKKDSGSQMVSDRWVFDTRSHVTCQLNAYHGLLNLSNILVIDRAHTHIHSISWEHQSSNFKLQIFEFLRISFVQVRPKQKKIATSSVFTIILPNF